MALVTNNTLNAESDTMLRGLITRRQYLDYSLLCWSGGLAISCCGVFTNIINIKTFFRMGVKDGVNMLFLALSFSDLAYVMFTSVRNSMAIASFMELSLGVWFFPVHPGVFALFSDNSAYAMYIVSALTSTFLAVARCMCVVRPLQFKHTLTRQRCIMALVPIYIFPLACQAAVFCEMGVVRKFDENKNMSRIVIWMSSNREKVKDFVMLILSSIIPLVNQTLLILCVPAMVLKLREGTKFRTGNTGDETGKEASSTKLSARDRQVVEQVVLISAIYIVVNIPNILISFLSSIDTRFDYGKRFEYFYRFIHNVRALLEAFNASVNIFVYYFYNSKFRSLCFSSRSKKQEKK